MNGYAEMIQEIFNQGLSAEKERIINNITENLIKKSGGQLTLEEARKKAEELTAPPNTQIKD